MARDDIVDDCLMVRKVYILDYIHISIYIYLYTYMYIYKLYRRLVHRRVRIPSVRFALDTVRVLKYINMPSFDLL